MKILYFYLNDIDTYYHYAKFHVNTWNGWLNVGKMVKKVIAHFLPKSHISRLAYCTAFIIGSF